MIPSYSVISIIAMIKSFLFAVCRRLTISGLIIQISEERANKVHKYQRFYRGKI